MDRTGALKFYFPHRSEAFQLSPLYQHFCNRALDFILIFGIPMCRYKSGVQGTGEKNEALSILERFATPH